VNVATVVPELELTGPETAAPPVTARVKVDEVIVLAFIAALKVADSTGVTETFVAPSAGDTLVTVGGVGNAVVKLHV
jgi:hypothetical protein